MINTKKLKLLDGLGYALQDIHDNTDIKEWKAFIKWFGDKPPYMATTGKKCIMANDLQLYIRLDSKRRG